MSDRQEGLAEMYVD